MSKYRVFFPGEKEFKNLTSDDVESHFPEINMRLFPNFGLTALVLMTKRGGVITITKED